MNRSYFVLKEYCKKFTFSQCCLDYMLFHISRETIWSTDSKNENENKMLCFVS